MPAVVTSPPERLTALPTARRIPDMPMSGRGAGEVLTP